MGEMPIIISERCDGCGLCLEVCQGSALKMAGKVVQIDEKGECDWCTLCEAVCLKEAIVCPFEIVTGKH
ncbi:MAG: 4Fe-4S binding protein [Chloroflexi bacterium]|nr:4Fe-4S binding protein [Chloroflexota bacterium]